MKKKKITLTLNDTIIGMIDELKEHEGYDYATEVILECIRFKHRDKFQTRIRKITKSVDEISDPVSDKRNKDEKMIKDKQHIIDALNGVLNEARTHVIYSTYDFKNVMEQEIPIELITDELIPTQYYPSKEKCLKLAGKNDK